MGKSATPTAPDYAPMAAASVEAARIGADLGREQMAESRRQYELSRQTAEPVVAAQLGLMRQQQAQGDDYYNYMVANQRPVEQAMNREAMAAGTAADQNEYASRAIADATTGYARAQNAAMRQGIRYGYSPEKMAAGLAANSTNQAAMQAAAANAGREQSKALGWAKKADVAGLYRGLTGASQGAYGMAMNAGTGAVGNQAGAGQRLLAGNATGAGMIQNGMGQKMQGLGGVLNAQTSVYNTDANNQQTGLDIAMGLTQAGASAYKAGMFGSDPRIKYDVELLGKTRHGLNWYEFSYVGQPGKRYRGVMSNEVEKVMPEAVSKGDDFDRVNYNMLGIVMEEVEVENV